MFHKLIIKICISVFKKYHINPGPVIVRKQNGDWWLIDIYGQIWDIRYTGQHVIPISISLFQK